MIRFVHTNIIARDWRNLAQFYIDVFGCSPILPDRDMQGEWIDNMTGLKNIHVQGIHLALPGYDEGPTLEIFGYNKHEERASPAINMIGLTHIAFRVDNVAKYADRVLDHGGSFYGKLIQAHIYEVGNLEAVYMKDPEGNIVELQRWLKVS